MKRARVPCLKLDLAVTATLLLSACATPERDVLVGIAAHPGGHQGAALAVEDLRARGIRVRLREASRGDASTSGVAAVALAQAFDEAGVVAVVGHSVSGATLSAAYILNQRGIPMVIPNATSPLLSGIGRWVFRICATDRAQGELLARHAFDKGFRNAGVLYVLDDYGKGLAAAFSGSFGRQGGRVAVAVGYSSIVDRSTEDLGPLFAVLRKANPDVLFLAGRARDIVQLKGGALLARTGGPPVIGGDAAFAPLDVQGKDALFEGMTITVMSPPASPAAKHFAERYREKFGAAADNPSYACYDAVSLIGLAAQGASATREGIRSYLARLGRDLPAYEGLTGPIRFDDHGDALDARFALAQVRKGAVTGLGP